ncbi:DUF4625 domain-containing protein [Flavisolibacter ginsenosidimutans]|uniref:DUF4625 domain-containing protein n=1 Tax=Flavisolibacter ginsenosidimutans TaxID=661481 RepID=A0A5B8UG53_9BACT|nr:DUF4625 domain-containing protein [Flavisolibacter ginsenosidimutans]QEC55392.1 DUF4625 domain-containing protein [Flavisolibacter ginsenosidimutans]
MKRNLPVLALFIVLFSGCKKDHGEAPDTTPPVIMLISPSNNQGFALGQSISIVASISDQSKIEEIHLEIINATTGAFLIHEHYVPDSSIYKLASSYTAASAATYKIKVEADDAKGNSSETEVSVKVN